MKALFLTLVLSFPLFAADSQAPSKEEMKRRLDTYVKDNQDASMSIEPLIKKLDEILAPKKAPAEKPADKR